MKFPVVGRFLSTRAHRRHPSPKGVAPEMIHDTLETVECLNKIKRKRSAVTIIAEVCRGAITCLALQSQSRVSAPKPRAANLRDSAPDSPEVHAGRLPSERARLRGRRHVGRVGISRNGGLRSPPLECCLPPSLIGFIARRFIAGKKPSPRAEWHRR